MQRVGIFASGFLHCTLSSQISVARRLIFLAFCIQARTFPQVLRLIFSKICIQARLFESGIVSNCAHDNSVVFRGIVMKMLHSVVQKVLQLLCKFHVSILTDDVVRDVGSCRDMCAMTRNECRMTRICQIQTESRF